MTGSGMIAQTLLPGKNPEALQRNVTQKKSDQTFAELFEKRMQVRRESATVPVTPSNRVDRQTTALDRQKETRTLDRSEVIEKPVLKNPAKEKMKELMKKVKDTLEAMKDPDVSPEQLQKMAEDLKDYLGQIKALVETVKEPAQTDATTEVSQEIVAAGAGGATEAPTVAGQILPNQVRSEKDTTATDNSEENPEVNTSEVRQGNRQAPELKGNPILKDLEKVIDAQTDILAEYPDVKKVLEKVLTDIKAIQGVEVAKSEVAFTDKLETLMAKLNGIVVKIPETKSAEVKSDVEGTVESEKLAMDDANVAQTVSAVTEDSGVSTQTADTQTSDDQMAGQNQQGNALQPATESKDVKNSEKSSKAVEASTTPLEKASQTATKSSSTQPSQVLQNPQAFQDTLDAVKDGIQAKGQFQSRIMEQVIESVKTNFKADDMKSEMIMKLKPESLGNVSLKVSIEKGVVMAELQVESQAVKQALESNLQDLRSALQDKGFNVFDLNVSVRKDNQNQQQNNSGKSSQTRVARLEGNVERLEQRLMSLESAHNQSTIDYLG